MSEKILWSLWTWEDKRDFTEEIVAWSDDDFGAKVFDGYMYNQKLVDNYSCTGQAACQMITSFTWIVLPLSFRKKVWERQLQTGAKEGFGDYTQNGVKQAVKLFNEIVEKEYPELGYKLEYFRTRIDDALIRDYILKEWSPIVLTYKWSLFSDAQDNGIIDNEDNVGNGGHVVTGVKIYKENDIVKDKYVDNYQGVNEKNIITVPNFDNNKDFYPTGYYLKKKVWH